MLFYVEPHQRDARDAPQLLTKLVVLCCNEEPAPDVKAPPSAKPSFRSASCRWSDQSAQGCTWRHQLGARHAHTLRGSTLIDASITCRFCAGLSMKVCCTGHFSQHANGNVESAADLVRVLSSSSAGSGLLRCLSTFVSCARYNATSKPV